MSNPSSKIHNNTPVIDITSTILNERNQSINTQPIGLGLPSQKRLKVVVIQSLGVNLLNKFVNETQDNASSSTSHISTKKSATFTITPNGHIESENSNDENATYDYSSDSACEFQKEDANYDISSSFDDE